jgi:hypothetical protein
VKIGEHRQKETQHRNMAFNRNMATRSASQKSQEKLRVLRCSVFVKKLVLSALFLV